MGRSCLIVTDDLIFATRIAGAATAAGWTGRKASSGAEIAPIINATDGGEVSLAFVDVEALGSVADEAIRAIKAEDASIRVVAFHAHVDAAGGAAARDAGADAVLPRSQFVQQLPNLFADAH